MQLIVGGRLGAGWKLVDKTPQRLKNGGDPALTRANVKIARLLVRKLGDCPGNTERIRAKDTPRAERVRPR